MTQQVSEKEMLSIIKSGTHGLTRSKIEQLVFHNLWFLLEKSGSQSLNHILHKTFKMVSHYISAQSSFNILKRLEISLGLRKPAIGIYDHNFHFIGGGQKYGLTAAHALQDDFEVTLIASREVEHSDFLKWYNLNLSKCRIKIIRLPFFDEMGVENFDPVNVTKRTANPFHAISRESENYDIFINSNMLEKVYPLANISIMFCYFPERRPENYFYADQYDQVVSISDYSSYWIKNRWQIQPDKKIFPPVDMRPDDPKNLKKENLILSVARFDEGSSKKQLEMVRAFARLQNYFDSSQEPWKLILAGGAAENNKYVEKIREYLIYSGVKNVEVKTNLSNTRLKELYARAKIFWHLCGLYNNDPALVEHFGITIVEAMQNGVVPVVYDGGGQKEIVQENKNGFLVRSLPALISTTIELIRNRQMRNVFASAALQRGEVFTQDKFETEIALLVNSVTSLYYNPEP